MNTGPPHLTVASVTASGDQDTARRLREQAARIETLERQVVSLTAEVRRLQRVVQPLSPELLDRLTADPLTRTRLRPPLEHKHPP